MSQCSIHSSHTIQPDHPIDSLFYLDADAFFPLNAPSALTYDDVSLATLYSSILPKQTQVGVTLSENLKLNIPILSSDMDTVTEARMAIAMATHGGMGLIHYNMSEERQIEELTKVKNAIHGLIDSPITIYPTMKIGDVLELIEEHHYLFKSFPVVEESGKLVGLLQSQSVNEDLRAQSVADLMFNHIEVFAISEKAILDDPLNVAARFFHHQPEFNKLCVIDENQKLKGLFSKKDVKRLLEEVQVISKPARDTHNKLVCGVAISAARTSSGDLDTQKILTHAEKLIHTGANALALSSAHGFTEGIGAIVQLLRKSFKDLNIIAGNVTSAAGVGFLAEKGANIIKIGQGPGSICTTRIVAGVGIPQLTALYVASKEAARKGVKILADGGITKSGDIVKALTLADAVICGNLLASSPEAPGKFIRINGRLYKQYRGMGSMEAMKAGSAARYGHDKKDALIKATAEGVEALKEVSESVHVILKELIGGLQSGLGYLGADNLSTLKQKARYVRVTPAGQKESAPHDIIQMGSANE